MTQEQILNSGLNKTKKAKRLFELGLTRRQVADLVMNGNYGFAHNVYKKWIEEQVIQQPSNLPFEFSFSRKYGIEIEVINLNVDRMITECRRLGLEVNREGYNHQTRGHWKIVTDSSLRGANGYEVVSPILQGREGIEQLKTICIGLKKAGAKVNSSCGLHVHMNGTDLTFENIKQLYANYIELEAGIDQMMPNSRRGNNNTYCKGLSQYKRRIMSAQQLNQLNAAMGTRYVKLNLQSYARQGSVEFRQHSGTTSFLKMKNWILICARMVEFAKNNGFTNNLNSLLDEHLQDYYTDRTISLVA